MRAARKCVTMMCVSQVMVSKSRGAWDIAREELKSGAKVSMICAREWLFKGGGAEAEIQMSEGSRFFWIKNR